jgi:uncharacterized repeat protein (TIGR01451 family)
VGRGALWNLASAYLVAAVVAGALPLSSSAQLSFEVSPVPQSAGQGALDPPYVFLIPLCYGDVTLDGNGSDAMWASAAIARAETAPFGGFSLELKAFHNGSTLFLLATLKGDADQNPNDRCELCFDADGDGSAVPEPADIKLVAENTKIQDAYALYHGDGAGGWTLYSDDGGNPNPWPSGYAAYGEIDGNASYEFSIPMADAWQNGTQSGLCVHAFNQGTNRHVAWPDWTFEGINPPIDPSDDPSGWGDAIRLGPKPPRTKTLYLHDDGPINQNFDVWDVLNTTSTMRWLNITDYDTDGRAGKFIRDDWATSGGGWDYTLNNRFQYWNLTPPLSEDLRVSNANVTLWLVAQNNDPQMTFCVELLDNQRKVGMNDNVVARVNITNADLGGNWPMPDPVLPTIPNFGKVSVIIPFRTGTNYTFVKGHRLLLLVYRWDNRAGRMHVHYDCPQYPSHLNLTTDTYVNVNWTRTFNATVQTNAFNISEDVRIFSNLTDPFGSYDIRGAKITVMRPGGAQDVILQNMSLVPIASPDWKLFNFTYKNTTAPGMYVINVTAIESNGVTSSMLTFFNVTGIMLVPDHLVYVGGDAQVGQVGQTLPTAVQFRVVNRTGVPTPGAPVNFTIYSWPATATGYSFVESGARWFDNVSDPGGLVSATMVLGNRTGIYWVNVSSPALPALGGPKYNNTIDETATPGAADRLVWVSGGGASGTVGTAVLPFVMRVEDSLGNPVQGSKVWWNATAPPLASGYSLSAPDSTSNASGLVTTTLTLGNRTGMYNVTCQNLTLTGVPDAWTFYSNATAGAAYRLTIIQGGGGNAQILTPAPLFVARVEDSASNPVANSRVWWSVTAPPGSSGYWLSENQSVSAADGLVSSTLMLGNRTGHYAVTCANATLTGAPKTVWFNTTATPRPAYSLVKVSGDGQTGPPNTVLPLPLSVKVVDDQGNPVPAVRLNLSFIAAPVGATGHSLSAYDMLTQVWGTANVSLTLGNLAGGYTVLFRNLTLGGTQGVYFNGTAVTQPADHLVWVQGGGGTAQVAATVPKFVARVVDAGGAGVSGVDVTWTIAIPLGSTGHSLTNYTSTSDASGIVATTLTLGTKVGTYWANATDLALPGSPKVITFVTTAACASPFTLVAAANRTVVPAQGLADITVWLNDTYGNPCPGRVVSLVITSNPSGPMASVASPAAEVSPGVYLGTYTAGTIAFVTDVIMAGTLGLSDTVSIDIVATQPVSIAYVSGNSQTARVSTRLPLPFAVVVKDQYGNPVPGVDVTWTLGGAPVGATGQAMDAAVNVTNATGIAQGYLRLGSRAGTYHVNATNATLALAGEPVHFSAVAFSPPHSLLIVEGNYQTATAGTQLPLWLVVEVRDAANVPVTAGYNVWFNVTTAGLNGDGAIREANPRLTDGLGRARVIFTLDTKAGINNVRAEISGLGTRRVTFTENGTAPFISAYLESTVLTLKPGFTVDYILHFDNVGASDAADLWVNDTIPQELEYVPTNVGVTPLVSGQSISWYFPPSIQVGWHSLTLSCRLTANVGNGTVLHNSFHVDYYNDAGRKMAGVESNVVDLTVVTTTVENLPPAIEGVPDLVVHHDYDYRIDLSPYISDPDTPVASLFLIFSDIVNVRLANNRNLLIILNYSVELNGTLQPLNITVSDGQGSDSQTIHVKVTDDFPPVVREDLPDVSLLEDTIVFPFVIMDYFDDPDHDTLFITTGQRYVNITIFDNYTVKIRTELANWFGMERVRFRATDPTGALVESSINITVTPVNDAPTVQPLPDQAGKEDKSWFLDITSYVADVDDDLASLVVTTDSENVVVNGMSLTFRFSAATENEVVTVTVSDGKSNGYRQLNVTVEGVLSPMCMAGIPLAIIGAIALAAFLVYRQRNKPIVENAFLIYMDGALIAHATKEDLPDFDNELFSSMLTAIQGFVKDSFKDGKDWTLKKLEFGDRNIWIEPGKNGLVSLALVYKGGEVGLEKLAIETLGEIEAKYGKVLKDWDGNLSNLWGAVDIVNGIFKGK